MKDVVAGPALQDVVAVAAIDEIGDGAAGELVVAGAEADDGGLGVAAETREIEDVGADGAGEVIL
ncbi:hypothetical protein ACFTIK_09270, partial [Tistrella mobilis]|uniref:hypothetical protein n=1 Tax=Tistrella mobilis TaxID=171437 RepID=UPI00363AA456